MTDTTAPRQPIRTEVERPLVAHDPVVAGKSRNQPAAVARRGGDSSGALAAWAEDTDRVPVFTLEHDDGRTVTYTMPAKPNPGIALRFLRDLRTQGDAALIGLLEVALEPAGAVDALIDTLTELDPDEGNALMGKISERVQRNLSGNLTR